MANEDAGRNSRVAATEDQSRARATGSRKPGVVGRMMDRCRNTVEAIRLPRPDWRTFAWGLLILIGVIFIVRNWAPLRINFFGWYLDAPRAVVFAVFFAVAMLASVGLPGTSGFIGEFLIILGAVKFNPLIAVFAGTTLIIGVCYMLWLFQRIFYEKTSSRLADFRDLTPVETLTLLPIVILIIVMGIYPQPFIEKIEPSAEQQIAVIEHVQHIAGVSVGGENLNTGEQ